MSIYTLLEQQHQLLSDLLTILYSEQNAITSRDAASIEVQAQQKQHKLNQIQQQDALIGRHPDAELLNTEPALQQKVSDINGLLQQCQVSNDANGEALQRAQLAFHKLNNLFLQSRGKTQMGYNSQGAATNVRSLGTNVKA